MDRKRIRGIRRLTAVRGCSCVLLAVLSWQPQLVATGIPAPMVFIASEANSPPMDIFEKGVLTGGIVRDIDEAIAARMGVGLAFLNLPRKRIDRALASGDADALCYGSPDWYTGDLKWSVPFIPNAELVLARPGIDPVTGLDQLRGHKVGTVLGYVYPDLDVVIGGDYIRDDAPMAAASLRKLEAGRFDYAIVDQRTLEWQLRQDPDLRKLQSMVVYQIKGRCAFSPKSHFSFGTFSRTIDDLIQDGTVNRILAHYR